MAWATAPTFSTGQTAGVSAGLDIMSTNINLIGNAWPAYTPTLTNITLGNGTLSCAVLTLGKLIIGRVGFNAGSTTTYSAGQLLFSCPVTPHAVYTSTLNAIVGVGDGFVSPAGTKSATTITINGSGQFQMVATSSNSPVTNTVPATFGTSGQIGFTFTYQAA